MIEIFLEVVKRATMPLINRILSVIFVYSQLRGVATRTGTIKDVEHGEYRCFNFKQIYTSLSVVVLFMQENRAFDHVCPISPFIAFIY